MQWNFEKLTNNVSWKRGLSNNNIKNNLKIVKEADNVQGKRIKISITTLNWLKNRFI
jgi:hypothetical protein